MNFIRDYEIKIDLLDAVHYIKPPIRIAFDCTKSFGTAANKLNLQISNLAEPKRLALVKDAEDRKHIPFEFRAGYKGSLELLFKGNVHIASTSRSGADLITTIETLDGGFDMLNSFTSRTVIGKDLAIKQILKDMKNTDQGAVTKQIELVRPKVLVGNSASLIREQLGPGESFYIDEERLNIIKDAEYIGGYMPVVSVETGLMTTPTRQSKKVSFQTMLNPLIKIGGLVDLRTKFSPHLNGIYKVESIGYAGDSHGNDWNQTVTCYIAQGMKSL